MTGEPTVGGLLRRSLRAAGVGALYGDPVDGLDVVPASHRAARVLAAVDRDVNHRSAGAVNGRDITVYRAGPSVSLPTPTVVGTPPPSRLATVTDIAGLPPALTAAAGSITTVVLDRGLDLARPAGRGVPMGPPDLRGPEPLEDDVVAVFRASTRAMVLAGPGVVRAGAVPGLHALAAAGRLGVLNTWGAKGVFDWRSRHHLATAGLQAEDFVLGGLPDSDLVIATGLDASEAPSNRWSDWAHVLVDPRLLGALAETWTGTAAWPVVPPLRVGLARVTQDGWAATGSPLAPTQATRAYGTVLGRYGRIAADAGTAGYWVARTFSTVNLGSAHVPGPRTPGFAAAVALVTRLTEPWRPVLAVLDGPPDELTLELLELADRLGVGFGVECWSPDGAALGADAHLERLHRLAVADRTEVVTLATDARQLDAMIAVAGPVVAWAGPNGGAA